MELAALGRALVFQFPGRATVGHSVSSGRRLLVAFGVWALLLQPAQRLLVDTLPLPREVLLPGVVLVGLVGALFLQFCYLRLPATEIGFRQPAKWSAEERWFLLQATLALIAVSLFAFAPIYALKWQSGGALGLGMAILLGLVWGGVQEWIYRGWLQTELQRRWGAAPALWLANLVFTFGPLHNRLFHWGSDQSVAWATFAAIFAIGLLFGFLYQRSGNLWLPAILHGLWPLNMPV